MRKPTIYEALVSKLGRHPTNAELKADVQRIKSEGLMLAASQGKLAHQRGKRGKRGNPSKPGAELVGRQFLHKHWLDSSYPNSEKVPQEFKITAVRGGSVYIRPIYDKGQSGERLGSAMHRPLSTFEEKDVLRWTNPNPGTTAEKIAKDFHGRPVREIIDVEEEEVFSDNLAVIGCLVELNILCDGGKNAIPIRFSTAKGKEVYVATSDGESIEFVGGDQEIVNLEKVAKFSDKPLVTVGKVDSIVYLADKHHLKGSNGKEEEYEHYLGRKKWFGFSKERYGRPDLVQDTINKKLLLVGGTYSVKDVGIVD